MKKISVIFKALGIVIGILAIIIVIARCYFRIPVRDYYKTSEKEFRIPGLNTGFIPQGICHDKESGDVLLTGYSKSGTCYIYRVDSDGNNLGYVSLCDSYGNVLDCHAGGIALHNDYLYVAGGFDRCLYVFDYVEVRNASDGDAVNSIGAFSLEAAQDDYLTVACLTTDDTGIYIAEFYRQENYPTLDSHKLVTEAGDNNNALAIKYAFSDENSYYGISKTPECVYSIPDKIQGICVKDGKIYMSSSYAAAFSDIYKYDEEKSHRDKTMVVMGTSCPLYECDSNSLDGVYKIAPMAEEIEIVDDYMYTMCESASNKYIFGKFTSSEYCYGTKMSFFQ